MNNNSATSRNIASTIWQLIRFDFQLLWLILTRPQITLQYPRLSEYFHRYRIFRNFILPMSIITALVNLIGAFFSIGKINIEGAVINSVFIFISFILTFYALYIIIKWIATNAFNPDTPRWNIEATVAATMSVAFAVKIILSIVPDMFFVQFFYVYTFYIVWVTSDSLIPIPEQQKNRFMIIITLICLITPWIIDRLMRLMVPNIQC